MGAALVVLGAGAALTWLVPPDSSDLVSADEAQSRQTEFTQLEQLPVSMVASAEIDAALDEMQLAPTDRAELRERLEGADPSAAPGSPAKKELQLARVSLWDTHAQDGDVVAVSSSGYRREVLITNAPQVVFVPVDGAAVVQIIGVRDGGGGITLGASGSDGSVLMPIMAVGQTIGLPVKF